MDLLRNKLVARDLIQTGSSIPCSDEKVEYAESNDLKTVLLGPINVPIIKRCQMQCRLNLKIVVGNTNVLQTRATN